VPVLPAAAAGGINLVGNIKKMKKENMEEKSVITVEPSVSTVKDKIGSV
jgi:hypothetical protein